MSDMEAFIVTGIHNGERYAGMFAATSVEDAELQARSVVGASLEVAAIIAPGSEINTAGYPPEMGPGAPGWELACGNLNEDPSAPPAVGDYIYVPFCDGGHFTAPNGEAGIARVLSVEDWGRGQVGVQTHEHCGVTTNWTHLASKQRGLHEHYRYCRAGMSDER